MLSPKQVAQVWVFSCSDSDLLQRPSALTALQACSTSGVSKRVWCVLTGAQTQVWGYWSSALVTQCQERHCPCPCLEHRTWTAPFRADPPGDILTAVEQCRSRRLAACLCKLAGLPVLVDSAACCCLATRSLLSDDSKTRQPLGKA